MSGPDYLKKDTSCWPTSRDKAYDKELPDMVAKVLSTEASPAPLYVDVIDVKRFSNVNKLLRVTGILLKIAK